MSETETETETATDGEVEQELETAEEALDNPMSGGVVEMQPPDIRTSRLGILGEILTLRKHIKKRRKLLSRGYVQWYLVDDGFPAPKYVKPDAEGGGVREYEYKGERYLFPGDAMVPDKSAGVWTVVHKQGDALPINLRDPSKHALPTDELQEYTTLRATSSPPSFFDKLDMDASDLVKYLIVAAIGFAVLQGVMGGGVI